MYMDIKEFTEIIKNSIDKEGLFPHIGYGITKMKKEINHCKPNSQICFNKHSTNSKITN